MIYRILIGFTLLALFPASLISIYADDTVSLLLEAATVPSDITLDTLLDPAADAWKVAASQPIKLSRTPPLYEGDPSDDGQRPKATVQLFRIEGQTILLRCHWTDASEDNAEHHTRYQDAGEAHVYKEHTTATDAFSDAFCVMIPKDRGSHISYPSMMMGNAVAPVDLYYWRAGKGFECLDAHGRSTTGPAGQDAQTESPLQGQSIRDEGGWSVVMALPNVTPHTPLCFAIWDGGKLHRDGLKYFSLWYEIK